MTTGQESVATGGCLCGAVRYEVRGEVRSIINCHCGQCRRFGGHFGAYTHVGDEQFTLARERGLKWYRSSDAARRGFCAECGSTLTMHESVLEDRVQVCLGSLDRAAEVRPDDHVWTTDQLPWLRLDDDRPRFARNSSAVPSRAAGAD